MVHHVYSYSQSASCLSGGSLPDPWGERQWAAGDSRDKMLEVRGREERGVEKSETGPLFKHTLCIIPTSRCSTRQLRLWPGGLNLVCCRLYSRSTSGCLVTEDKRLGSGTEITEQEKFDGASLQFCLWMPVGVFSFCVFLFLPSCTKLW